MAEGKDASFPFFMDHFDVSLPSSAMSQNSAPPSSLQNIPQVIQDPLKVIIQEFLNVQSINEDLRSKVYALSKEVEDLKRQLVTEKSEKKAAEEKYQDLLQKANPLKSSGPQSRLPHPQSLNLSGQGSRSTHVGLQEEGSLQGDGGIPSGWHSSLMSDDYDGIVRKGEKFMQQEVESAQGVSSPVRKTIPEDDAIPEVEETPEVKVTTDHLDFMAGGLDTYNWQTYMRALGVYDSELEDIRYNYRDNAYEQRYQALLFWRNKSGLDANPEALVLAALRRNQRLLAEKFCKQFGGFEHLLKKAEIEKKKPRPKSEASPQDNAKSDIAAQMAGMSISSSEQSMVSSFKEEEHYATIPGDQAIPTTPPHYPLHQSTSSPQLASSLPPPDGQQSVSSFFVLIQGYMKNSNDGTRLLNEILQFPFVGAQLNVFINNLLKHHDESIFIKTVNTTLPQSKTWLEVFESWAKCVTNTDIARWKDRPPIFLWNLCRALHTSGFSGLYDKIKRFLKPGSVGPSLPHGESLSDTKWSLLNEVGLRLLQQVAGASDWRKMAENLGCNKEIPIWEQRGDGGKNVLQVYKTRGHTVGDLYEMLYKMNRNDIVKCMEDLKYTL